MEKETKHTPERWEAKLIFRTDRDKVGVWVVTDLTDGTQLFMKLNTSKVEYHAKLIASAPALKAENERLTKALKSSDDALTQNASLQTELSEMKENYEGMVAHCKYLTEINVFNICFDKADEHWRKSHKVEEGDNFIDWYMRHHAAEREADRKQLSEMKKEREELVKEVDRLKKSLDSARKSIRDFGNPTKRRKF